MLGVLILAPYQIRDSQIFYPIQCAAFSFCRWFSLLCRSFLIWLVPLVYFCFWCFLKSGFRFKKSLPRPMSKHLPFTFSSRSFMLSGLTFRSLIHLELISVYSVRQCWVYFFACAIQFSQYHLLKRLSFPPCIFLSPLL